MFNSHVPCHNHAILKVTSQGHGTARHGHGHAMCDVASTVQTRHVGDLQFGYVRATTWTFTKDTALLENGRGAAWHGNGM
jgi:hypothetical protein